MENRYIIWTPAGYEANKKWHVEDNEMERTVFTCEYEGDASKEADRLNAADNMVKGVVGPIF